MRAEIDGAEGQIFDHISDVYVTTSDNGHDVRPCNKPEGNSPRCIYFKVDARLCAFGKGLRLKNNQGQPQVICPRYNIPLMKIDQ